MTFANVFKDFQASLRFNECREFFFLSKAIYTILTERRIQTSAAFKVLYQTNFRDLDKSILKQIDVQTIKFIKLDFVHS